MMIISMISFVIITDDAGTAATTSATMV